MQTRKRPLTDGHEGLRVLKILNSSQRSLNVNGEKISLNNSELNEESPKVISKNNYFLHETSILDEDVTVGEKLKYGIFHMCCPIQS